MMQSQQSTTTLSVVDQLAPFGALLAAARATLRGRLGPLLAHFPPSAPVDLARLEALLLVVVCRDLERLLSPTLALEVNVARLEGRLNGVTPEERFADYLVQLGQPAQQQALQAEYPVLFQLAATRLDRWVTFSLEVIERLCQDWAAIRATLAPANSLTALPDHPLGALQRIEPAQRTTKREGRAVLILTFTTGFKVVYKPRSLAIEAHFQALLTWLNDAGFTPAFRLLPLLDRGSYGWMAWVTAQPCYSQAELQRFYQRQGALLALLYALEATDLHLSNVIAYGEDPMLIDLEALFHPRDAEPDWPPLELAVDRFLYHSVLRPGLLPEPETGDDEDAVPIDLSGLGGIPGQQTPYAVPTWQGRNTDSFHLTYQPKTIRGGSNLPTLQGAAVEITAFYGALDAGFTACYRLLMRQRARLSAAAGPLAAFADAEVRVIARPGQQYGEWLEQSLHPNLLRDGAKRARFLAQLGRTDPTLAPLLPYEQAALRDGDVPLFTTKAAGRTLYCNGQPIVADFFPQAGLAAAQTRLAALTEADLSRQRWLIRAALATVPTAPYAPAAPPLMPVATSAPDLTGQLIAAATAVGERLAATAVSAAGEATWIGVTLHADRYWLVEALESGLAQGLPGVALFLAHLGQVTGEGRWTTLAQAAMTTVQRYQSEAVLEAAADGSPLDEPLGLLSGLGGQLYALAHLAQLWPAADWRTIAHARVDQIAQHAARLAELTVDEPAADVAGLLVGLLAMQQRAPRPQTLRLATKVGRHLLQRLDAGSVTAAAPAPPGLPQPFADFFQAPAGLAWPLLTLAALTADQTMHAAAQQLVATDPPATASLGLWLAYLRAVPFLNCARQRALAECFQLALPALRLAAVGHNDALGYGALGYSELLLQAATAFSMPVYADLAQRYGQALVERSAIADWTTAVPLAVPTPALWTGLAGIGYGLLRLAQPAAVPALLAFELPVFHPQKGAPS